MNVGRNSRMCAFVDLAWVFEVMEVCRDPKWMEGRKGLILAYKDPKWMRLRKGWDLERKGPKWMWMRKG